MEKLNDSRDSILEKIKANKPSPRKLPAIPMFEVAGDALRNFLGHLKGFDGEYQLFATRNEAVEWLKKNVMTRGGNIYSAVGEIAGNFNSSNSYADFQKVDICMAESIVGVGETGSLLVDVRSLGNPAAALFSTDLFLLIDRQKILSSLQEAYNQIDLADFQYSSFFSGPSATADIEAVHITGAQGEISLTALVYNCAPDELTADASVAAATPLAPAITLRRETDPAAGRDSV